MGGSPWVAMGWAAAIVICVGIRCLQLGSGLPSINRFSWETDEGTPITSALIMGKGQWQPGTFGGAHLYMYLLTAVYGVAFVVGRLTGAVKSAVDFALSYWTDPTLFYLLGRGLSMVAGVATVALTYRLARRHYGEAAGRMAGWLMLALPVHVAMSQHAESDALATLLTTVSLASLVAGPLTSVRAFRGGLLGGLAASTKYNAGVALAALVVLHLLDRRRDWRSWRAHGPLVVGFLSFLMGFAIGTPAAVVYPREFFRALVALEGMGSGPSGGYVHSLISAAWDLTVGPGYVIVIGLGMGVALYRRTRTDLALLSAFALNYLVMAQPGHNFNSEYMLPSAPAALVLAGRALAELRSITWGWRAVSAGVFGMTVAGALGVDAAAGLASRDTTYLASRRWIETRLPAGTGIAMRDMQVPQLTFTPEALARRRAWNPRPTVKAAFVGSRYEAFRGSRLAQLRDQALTTGMGYDIYFLMTPDYAPHVPHFYPLGPSGLQERFHVQAVVTGAFDSADPSADPIVAAFYEALKRDWRCVAEIQPGWTRSGIPLWVYAAPELADQLRLPSACG